MSTAFHAFRHHSVRSGTLHHLRHSHTGHHRNDFHSGILPQFHEFSRVSSTSRYRFYSFFHDDLRYLIRIPIVCDEVTEESAPCIVLDKKSIRDISRELTRWGYHYNQAVHAMNSINYYIAHGKSNSRLLDEKAECIEVELATVNRNAERIVYEIAKLQDKMIVEAR